MSDHLFNLIDMLWGEIPLNKEKAVLEIARTEHPDAWREYAEWCGLEAAP